MYPGYTKKKTSAARVLARVRPPFQGIAFLQASAGLHSLEIKRGDFVYVHGRRTNSARRQTFFSPLASSRYMLQTRDTAWELALLRYFTLDVVIGRQSFHIITRKWNLEHHERHRDLRGRYVNSGITRRGKITSLKMDKRRLMQAWFRFQLIQFVERQTPMSNIDFAQSEANLITQAKGEIETSPSPWLFHRCTRPGCNEKFFVLDGEEKIFHLVCSAPEAECHRYAYDSREFNHILMSAPTILIEATKKGCLQVDALCTGPR